MEESKNGNETLSQKEKVQKYLAEKEKEKKEEAKAERDKVIIEAGLFSIVFAEKRNTSCNGEFPFYWTSGSKRGYFYKKVAYEVSDDEYKKIVELRNKSEEKPEKQETQEIEETVNPIGKIFTVFAVLCFLGAVIGGIITIIQDLLTLAPIIIASGFVAGVMCLGIAEIIKLLHAIRINTKTIAENTQKDN